MVRKSLAMVSIFGLLITSLLSCGPSTPSANSVQTAKAQTQVAQLTFTDELVPIETVVVPINISVPSETRAPTNTPNPTATPAPFFHPSDTPAVSQRPYTSTATVQPLSTIRPELALKETQIANFSVDCGASDFSPYNTILSPQGNWLAVSCGYEENQTLQIYSKTGKKWVVQFKDYVAKEFIRDGQTPMGTLYPVRWTNDELYLYFRSTLGISAGGTCFYGGWGQGLYRLKIENGTVLATLPPLRGGGLYIFSFSPSGRWLAYTRSVPTILDLRTGEEIYLQEGKNNIGDFAWSPDGSKLAYSTCQLSEDYSTERKSAIKIFSLETRESITILQLENAFLRIDLVDDNRLKIYDEHNYHSTHWFFDWSTEQLITPTFTPKP